MQQLNSIWCEEYIDKATRYRHLTALVIVMREQRRAMI